MDEHPSIAHSQPGAATDHVEAAHVKARPPGPAGSSKHGPPAKPRAPGAGRMSVGSGWIAKRRETFADIIDSITDEPVQRTRPAANAPAKRRETLADIIDSITDEPVHRKRPAAKAPARGSHVQTTPLQTTPRRAEKAGPAGKAIAHRVAGGAAPPQPALQTARHPEPPPGAVAANSTAPVHAGVEPAVSQSRSGASGTPAIADDIAALRALDEAYLNEPRGAWEIIDRVAAWANAPLTGHAEGAAWRAQAFAAIHRLEQATRDLDPRVASHVVAMALPAYERIYADNRAILPDNALFGPLGMTPVVQLSAHIAGTTPGNRAIARLAAMGGWDANAVRNAIGAGTAPAYALEFARQLKNDGIDPSIVDQTIRDGILQFRHQTNAAIRADVEKLHECTAELAWLVSNDGAILSSEHLDDAIACYLKDKDPGLKEEEEKLRQRLAAKGTKLIHDMIALSSKTPPDSGCAALIAQTLHAMASDPATSLAISMALKNDPSLVKGEELNGIAGLFASAAFRKSGDLIRKWTGELASSVLRNNVLEKLKDLNLFDPGSVARARAAIDGLRGDSFAKLIGVSKNDLDKAIRAIDEAVDEIAAISKAPNQQALGAAQSVSLARLDDKLANDPRLVKAFARNTLAGQVMRCTAIGLAGLNLYNSALKFVDKPDAGNGLRAFVAGADFVQKSSDLLLSLGRVGERSALGQLGGGWKLMGRAAAGDLIAGISSALEAVNGVQSLLGLGAEQDTGQAIISFASAAGGGLILAKTLGAATWTGPVGLAITTAAVVGGEVYREAKDAHRYEEASKKFLMAAGYNEAAAEALSRRVGFPSGAAGAAQAPFLAQYAETFAKLSPTDFTAWINSLSPERVRSLSTIALALLNDGHDGRDQSAQRRPQWAGAARAQGAAHGPTQGATFRLFDAMLHNAGVFDNPAKGVAQPRHDAGGHEAGGPVFS